MSRTPAAIAADIDAFEPQQGDWRGLDALVEELFATDSPRTALSSLFGVFERFPDDDGAGVFWHILHGIEYLDGYETSLFESIRHTPSRFTLIMTQRLMNVEPDGSIRASANQLILDLSQDVSAPRGVRELAQRFAKELS